MVDQRNFAGNIAYDDLREWLAMAERLGEVRTVKGANCEEDIGLAAAVDFSPPAITYTNGSHVAEVEVDIETGEVKLTRYIVVHDCGRMINPMMVEGQVHGGVAHGVGMTLY